MAVHLLPRQLTKITQINYSVLVPVSGTLTETWLWDGNGRGEPSHPYCQGGGWWATGTEKGTNGLGNPCDPGPRYVQAECDKFKANEGTLQIFHIHSLVGSSTTGQNDLVCICHITSVYEPCREHTQDWVSGFLLGILEGVLVRYTLRGRKLFRKMSLSWTDLFSWGSKMCKLRMGDMGRGT